jgi:hypothetical protein
MGGGFSKGLSDTGAGPIFSGAAEDVNYFQEDNLSLQRVGWENGAVCLPLIVKATGLFFQGIIEECSGCQRRRKGVSAPSAVGSQGSGNRLSSHTA